MATQLGFETRNEKLDLLTELARLIEQQGIAATRLVELTAVEKELYRVRAKRIELLLISVGDCKGVVSRRPLN